jgi:hypothetical protein
MYPYNRLIVRRSWYLSTIDSSLYSKHQDGERYHLRNKGKGKSQESSKFEPVHGPGLEYEEAVVMPNKFLAWLFSFSCFSFFALFFTSSIVSLINQGSRNMLMKVPMGDQQLHPPARRGCLQRVSLPLQNPALSLQHRKLEQGWYKIENVSETTNPNIQVITKVNGSGDPGYLNTCCTHFSLTSPSVKADRQLCWPSRPLR